MRILAIDTSSDFGSIAIYLDGEIASEVRFQASIQYSERLFRSIDFMLTNVGIPISQIDIFAAARGPGAFTGLRVGLAAIQGFAFSTGKRARGISTLSALAWQVGSREGLIAPMMDARRGQIYSSLLRRANQELIEVSPPIVLQPAELLQTLPPEPVFLCGPGAQKYRRQIEVVAKYAIVAVDPYLAATIAQMAAAGYEEPLAPLYLRRSSARRLGSQESMDKDHHFAPKPSGSSTRH